MRPGGGPRKAPRRGAAGRVAGRLRAAEAMPYRPPMTLPPAELYDEDFYTWALSQASALRHAAPLGLNTPEALDWLHVAEEIEDLGNEQADKLESAFRVLLWHLLKWRYQPDHRSGSWRATIVEQRKRVAKVLRRNPGLKSRQAALFAEAYDDARDLAAAETGLDVGLFPEASTWTMGEACDPGFWPDDDAGRG